MESCTAGGTLLHCDEETAACNGPAPNMARESILFSGCAGWLVNWTASLMSLELFLSGAGLTGKKLTVALDKCADAMIETVEVKR